MNRNTGIPQNETPDPFSPLALPRGDWRKALIAQVVKAETTVPLGWIAGRLDMGARSTVSREIGAMAKKLPKDAKLRRLRGKILATDE
jgi:hypothetical protein